MPINPALFSSVTDQWATPQWLFDALNEQFHFSVDVCALPHNAKCPKYYTPDDNGLNQEWRGICWMNPPYGNPEFPCKPSCSTSAIDVATQTARLRLEEMCGV